MCGRVDETLLKDYTYFLTVLDAFFGINEKIVDSSMEIQVEYGYSYSAIDYKKYFYRM